MSTMSAHPALERVIVVPRNGYANRLQAWASSEILGAQLDVPVSVLWQPEPVAPAKALDLFSPALVSRAFIDDETFTGLVGRRHEDLPRYLTIEGDTIVLAGHDRGEQVFMTDLVPLLATSPKTRTLVVIAGGTFHLPSDEDFIRQRSVFYRNLAWSAALDDRFHAAMADHTSFVGLHIRETDRSRQAPTPRAIRAALEHVRGDSTTRDLFIAADTAHARERWGAESARLGFRPWSLADADLDRSSVVGGLDALTDWRVLASTEALVYPAASTFSREAAIASGHHDQSIALTSTPVRQRVRALRDLGRSVLTFPARRLQGVRTSAEGSGKPAIDG